MGGLTARPGWAEGLGSGATPGGGVGGGERDALTADDGVDLQMSAEGFDVGGERREQHVALAFDPRDRRLGPAHGPGQLHLGELAHPFVFDPARRAVLLVGGNKAGQWQSWYRRAIPQAEELYARHIETMRRDER